MERQFYWVEMADVPQWLIADAGTGIRGKRLTSLGCSQMVAFFQTLDPSRPEISHPGEKRTFVFSVIEKAPIVSEAVANVFRTLHSR